MQHAALLTVASPVFGFGLANTLVQPVNDLLLTRYPELSGAAAQASDPAGITWLVAAAVLAATVTSFAAPRLLRAEVISDRWVRALSFAASLLASLVMAAVVFGCATSQPSSPPLHDAQLALGHAGRCLALGLLCAQVLVAISVALLRGHMANDLPPSKYSAHGYAALTGTGS